MQQKELLPQLYRSEFSRIVSVLCRLFGFEHIELAEDIASDTFLLAAETWGQKGVPDKPAAWLYTVAKNKAKDYLKRGNIYTDKVIPFLAKTVDDTHEIEIDLSGENIRDSQLQMMFAICDPVIPAEAQICLALRILCGFGIEEIADAFLSNKETINKRIYRAKEKLKQAGVKLETPDVASVNLRLNNVLATLYLLFNEGYYSHTQNSVLRKELCLEAMRLNYLLLENANTNVPAANALLSLMCFHASRFEARTKADGQLVLYDEQDTSLWNDELIVRGEHYLNTAASGSEITKYHIEAAIAHWHTSKEELSDRWEKILGLYNKLLIIEYSPMAALNRTYALAKVYGKPEAIKEAEKLQLQDNQLFHALLGELYTDVDNSIAISHYKKALAIARNRADKNLLNKKIEKLMETMSFR